MLGAIGPGSFFKSTTSASVFIVMPENVRPVSSWGALLALTTDGKPVIIRMAPSLVQKFTIGPVALTAGTLVRSPSNATVYFINGVTSRVALSSFIYTSEAGFGPLVFATIQTVRQFLSVVLSIVVFAHPVNAGECAGIAVVFAALGGQIAHKANERRRRELSAAAERAR